MLFLKKVFFFLVTVALTTSTFAQPSNELFRKMAPDLLRQDFSMLRDALQKNQPSLYRYRTKVSIDHIFDSCFASIQDSMTIVDFYALTSFAIATMEDGHTNCRLPKAVMKDYMSRVNVFPAMLLFIHNRVYIGCCKQDDDLAGSELLSINDRSMEEITTRLFNYIPSDGSIESRKNWEMDEYFYLLYNLVYGAKDNFTITYRTKKDDFKTTTVKADILKNMICASPFPKPEKYLRLTYRPGHIAILTIGSFFDEYLQQTNENFSQFMDSAFSDIRNKKVQKLVIDIRGNHGGQDQNGALLYGYLSQKPFKYYDTLQTNTEIFPESRHPDLALQYPRENNFCGKVYFLTDGVSFSASAEFAAVAKSNARGLFLGEETGGGYYGDTGGDELTLNLSNTQISCRIPMRKYTMAVKKAKHPDRGVIPDYPIYPTVSDLVEKKDGQLESALRIVDKD